jgi:hypothetical protein
MTLNEIAYNIKNIVEGGISGEDSNLSLEQIKHMIHYHRALLLVKYTDSGRYVSEPMFQIHSTTLSASGGSTFPQVLGFPNNRAIKDITISDNSETTNTIQHVSLINHEDRQFFEASRFAPNKNQFYATIDGRLITIFDNDGETFNDSAYTLKIKGIFDNPTIVGGFSDSSTFYPIPGEIIESLVESILAKEFAVYLRTKTDLGNNSVDETSAQAAKTTTAASPSANARSRKARTR